MPRLLPILVCAALLAGIAAGCGGGELESAGPSAAAQQRQLAGAPAPLAALHRQANELLDGGPEAFEERIRALRGYPVVVNKWGSWCGPCIDEFPVFQRQALEHGKRVAFLGVDVQESKEEGRELLAKLPVSYPSYWDPRLNVSAVFNGVAGTPVTAFYDRRGKIAYLHQGPYLEDEDLAQDIRRYAR